MTTWGEGYVTDINYTSGYYRETSPLWLATIAALLGFRGPPPDRPYAYAELGCGQGLGTNLLAAANPQGRFFGFDFNPAQIANARRLACAGGAGNVEFHEASFQQLAASPEGAWPEFDFIVLHGIYTWVSRDNQLAILEFIRRFLRPGGLVYISYNCWAGWASIAPLRRLMRLHADRHPARSDVQGAEALAYALRLRDGGAGYFRIHGSAGERLEAAGRLHSHYLAHEYLNREWHLIDFADLASDCERAKLAHLGSAVPADNLDKLSVPPELLAMLQAEADPVLRQAIMDLATNKAFRRDIFQKGLGRLTPQEHLAALRQVRLLPLRPPPDGPVKFEVPIGVVDGRAELYGPLLAALARSKAGMTLEEIAALPGMPGMSMDNLVEVALLLMGAAYAEPALAQAGAAPGFNRAVCQAALDGHDYAFLAAPAIGGGIAASFTDMVAALLLAESPGLDADAFAEAAWLLLERHGQILVKNGAALDGKEAATAELRAVHAEFQAGKGAAWRRLGVLP